MDTKFGKLISRDREGTLTEVYPEILIDDEVDFADRRSRHPVTNIGVANAIDNALNTAKDSIKEAFSSSDGGLGWDESIQKGYVDFSQMPDSEIESIVNSMVDPDGAIIADSTSGKLTVDFSKLTSAQLMDLCLAGGGIVADQTTGKLKIDFSKIDPDTKRNITSSLKMQIPLTTNKTIYVDNINGNDTYLDENGIVIEGKAETAGTAFKTINMAVRFVTEQWATGTKSVTILLIANTAPYSEWVTLPAFNRTTGTIYIKSASNTSRAKIVNPGAVGTVINCVGGAYELQNLDIEAEFYKANNGRNNYPALIWASTYGSLNIAGCHCKISYAGEADQRWFAMRMFGTSKFGRMQFILINGSHNTFEYHKNNASYLSIIQSENNGWFNFGDANTNETVSIDIPVSNETTFQNLLNQSTYSSLTASNSESQGKKIVTGQISVLTSFMNALGIGTNWAQYISGESLYQLEAWGECTVFCVSTVMSLVRYGSGSLYKSFFYVPPNRQATGKRYECTNSSSIFVTMAGAFPGNSAGTVEEATYCVAKTALG